MWPIKATLQMAIKYCKYKLQILNLEKEKSKDTTQ